MSELEKQAQVFWQELDAMYERLIEGKDVSPSMHYRLEGKAELLVRVAAITNVQVEQQVEHWLKKMARQLPEGYWKNYQKKRQVRLPVYMVEAPVYKGA